MSTRPNLIQIEKRMQNGKNFTLTRADYIKLTGVDIPQDKYYTERRSAVARRARDNGYVIEVIPEKLVFKKVL